LLELPAFSDKMTDVVNVTPGEHSEEADLSSSDNVKTTNLAEKADVDELTHKREYRHRRHHSHHCRKDVRRFCTQTWKDGKGFRGMVLCLRDNLSELSDKCKSHLQKWPLMVCADDLNSVCPQASKKFELKQCIKENEEKFSKGCIDSIKAHKKRKLERKLKFKRTAASQDQNSHDSVDSEKVHLKLNSDHSRPSPTASPTVVFASSEPGSPQLRSSTPSVDSRSHSGLSTREIVVLSVMSVIGVSILFGFIFLLVRYVRNRKNKKIPLVTQPVINSHTPYVQIVDIPHPV